LGGREDGRSSKENVRLVFTRRGGEKHEVGVTWDVATRGTEEYKRVDCVHGVGERGTGRRRERGGQFNELSSGA